MTLVNDIRELATTPSYSLADLLRKCKILAARLDNEAFATWVNSELIGYEGNGELPSYRLVRTHSIGHFVGPYQAQRSNIPIPPDAIPKDLREVIGGSIYEIKLKDPIKSLEDMVARNSASFELPWPPDLLAALRDRLMERFQLVKASKVLSRNVVVGIVDIVRTKVLDFALEIERRDPQAGETSPGQQIIPRSEVESLVRKIISERPMGNTINIHGNVQTGTANFGNAAVVGSGNSTGVAQVGAENSAGVQNEAGIPAEQVVSLLAAFRAEVEAESEEIQRAALPVLVEMEKEVSKTGWTMERLAALMKQMQTIYTIVTPVGAQLVHHLGPWIAALAQGG